MPAQHIVWIDSTCIACGSCAPTCPDVFVIPEDMAMVLGSARVDGRTDENGLARSPLLHDLLDRLPAIEEAIEFCPVEAIHLQQA